MTVTPQMVAEAAREWIGTPYRHQASAKGQGTDCLGLLRGVWRELLGPEPLTLPPYTPAWTGEGEPLLAAARAVLRPVAGNAVGEGCVLIFRMRANGPAKHCGIALSPDRFVHAYDRREVTEARYSRWWASRLAGVFSFPGSEEFD